MRRVATQQSLDDSRLVAQTQLVGFKFYFIILNYKESYGQ